MSSPDYARIARALNNVATTLQQLAVELDASARAVRVVIPEGQLSVEELRAQLAGQPHFPQVEPPASMAMWAEPPATVAEPECGCSLYSRCDLHEHLRPKGCKCNGPRYASDHCGIAVHREQARSMPDRDPSLAD